MLYRLVNDLLSLHLTIPSATADSQPLQPLLNDANSALDTWHTLWSSLRAKAMAAGKWEDHGFFKNGDQYEAVIRLMLSTEARSHLRELMVVGESRHDRVVELCRE